MTTEAQQGRLDDGLTVLRRVRDYEVLQEENGNVSVYLASETTPERITRDYAGTYVTEVEIGAIRSQGLDVERESIEGDPGHCNITGRKTRSKSRSIARSSRWAKGYEPS